jgi:hypothetical protein
VLSFSPKSIGDIDPCVAAGRSSQQAGVHLAGLLTQKKLRKKRLLAVDVV